MRKIIYILFAVLGVGGGLQSCDDGETYAEQREKERDAISAFLNRDVVIRLSDGEELIHVGKINYDFRRGVLCPGQYDQSRKKRIRCL